MSKYIPSSEPNELIENCKIAYSNSGSPLALISQASSLGIIRKIWSRSDYRCFYIFHKYSEIWLTNTDWQVLNCFAKLFHVTQSSASESRLSVETSFCSYSASSLIQRPYALCAEWSSRGSYSFHFGHFIIDIIPLLLSLDLIYPGQLIKLVIPTLSPWALEVLDIYGLLSLSNLLEVTSSQESTIQHSGDSVRYLSLNNVRLVKLARSLKYEILRAGFNVPRLKYQPEGTRVLVLSRGKLPSNAPKRWVNEIECIDACSKCEVQVEYPEKIGPNGLINLISQYKPSLIIGSAGSALHQLLVVNNITPRVCIVMGGMDPKRIWKTQLSDFLYAGDRISILCIKDSINTDWNATFVIHPFVFRSVIANLADLSCPAPVRSYQFEGKEYLLLPYSNCQER